MTCPKTAPLPLSNPHLWCRDSLSGEWVAQAAAAPEQACVPIRRAAAAGAEVWVLLAGADVRVNGAEVRHGIRVLRDRDEISTEGGRMFFSLERVAKVEAFAGAAVPCGRCAGAIEDGAECVRCPACGAASHQSAELPCFTYGPTCPNCAQPSDLDAGFSWSPGEVGA